MLLFQDSHPQGILLLSVLVLWAFLLRTHLQLALEVCRGKGSPACCTHPHFLPSQERLLGQGLGLSGPQYQSFC